MTKRNLYDFLIKQDLISKTDLRYLLEFYFKQNFAQILTSEEQVSESDRQAIEEKVAEIKKGYPLAYILGQQEFFKSYFLVDSRVLIPRSETEFLVEFVTQTPGFKESKKILDIGAGSGCIGISLLKELDEERAHCTFIEKSPEAREVLKKNLELHRVTPLQYLIYTDLAEVPDSDQYDLIVSNPPYIDHLDPRLDAGVKKHEPSMALFAEDNGLDYLKRWSEWSMKHLKNTGKVFFEFGLDQEKSLSDFSKDQNWEYQILKDQYDVNRFWVIKKG